MGISKTIEEKTNLIKGQEEKEMVVVVVVVVVGGGSGDEMLVADTGDKQTRELN